MVLWDLIVQTYPDPVEFRNLSLDQIGQNVQAKGSGDEIVFEFAMTHWPEFISEGILVTATVVRWDRDEQTPTEPVTIKVVPGDVREMAWRVMGSLPDPTS